MAGAVAAPGPLTLTCPLHSQPKMTEYDKRCCCLREIQQTEEKYTDTLGSIQQVRCSDPAPGRSMRGSWAGRCASVGEVASGPFMRGHLCPKRAWSSSLPPLLSASSSLLFSFILSPALTCRSFLRGLSFFLCSSFFPYVCPFIPVCTVPISLSCPPVSIMAL